MSQDNTIVRRGISFNSFAEVLQLAKDLYAANCTPRGVDRPEKLVPMLLAGAELGLGVMMSLKYITPPVNGICSLWGDAGLALARRSGQLAKFEESIVGEGDNRKAVCKIQRTGYPEKPFEFGIKLAKSYASYKKAHEINPKTKEPFGGLWYDDPDNMLMWRARWRALRSEFTDVLNGMGGAEEQEEVITVEVVPAVPPPAAITAGNTTPALPAASNDQLQEIVRLNALMKQQLDFAADPIAAWAELLKPYAVQSARELSPDAADQFIKLVGGKYDPFTYPNAPTQSAT
jgi:hypothetical protein